MTLATLAHKMMLTPAQAIALPDTLDVAAKSVKMTRAEMVAICVAKPRVCEYLASICRQVTN